jgi:hypothetical protein
MKRNFLPHPNTLAQSCQLFLKPTCGAVNVKPRTPTTQLDLRNKLAISQQLEEIFQTVCLPMSASCVYPFELPFAQVDWEQGHTSGPLDSSAEGLRLGVTAVKKHYLAYVCEEKQPNFLLAYSTNTVFLPM